MPHSRKKKTDTSRPLQVKKKREQVFEIELPSDDLLYRAAQGNLKDSEVDVLAGWLAGAHAPVVMARIKTLAVGGLPKDGV